MYNLPMFNSLDLFLAMGIAWTVSGTVILATGSNRKKPDTPYAVFVLLVFALSILDNLARPDIMPYMLQRILYPFSRLSYYLIGPSIWLYTEKLINPEAGFRKIRLLHFLPFLLFFVYVLIVPASLYPKPVPGMLTGTDTAMHFLHFRAAAHIRDLSADLLRLFYSAAVLNIIRRHLKSVPDFYSHRNTKNTLSWLTLILIFYTILFSASLAASILSLEGLRKSVMFAAAVRYLPAVIFVFFFSIFARQQNVLDDSIINKTEADNGKTAGGKYGKSGINEAESRELYSRLIHHIEKAKPYLDPELTLNMLSEQMSETRHRISEVINRESGEKFYTFINRYRLEEFKNAVENRRYPDYTIIATAFECGFKSSSAFYSMFKKIYGNTPREFTENLKAG